MKTLKPILQIFVVGIFASAGLNHTKAQETTVVESPTVAPQVQQFLQPNNTDYLRNSQVLGIPTSHCGHVIDLMMSNRVRQQTRQIGTPEIYLPHLTVGTKTGDLELLCVQLVCDGDHCTGPIVEIGMKNNSAVPIGNFQVSVVGVLGQIQPHSPTMTVKIDRMECGEEKHIHVQLPATCMSIPCSSGQVVFDTLIVALDSFDELMECDELNNVRLVKRCDIPAVITQVTTPVESVPAAPAPAVPAAPVPDVPTDSGSLPGNLDLDDLELGDAKSLLFRKRVR